MQQHRSFLKASLIALFAAVFFVPSLRAQEYRAAISGEVRDPSGAKVPNAAITATDEQTHFKTSVKSNNVGSYSIPFLQPGSYTVQIEVPGFAPVERTNVVINAGDNKEVGFDLSVKASAEITITADSQVEDTGNANLGDTFDTKEVTDTPNIGRNPFNLVTLTGGTYSSVYTASKASQSTQPYGAIAVSVSSGGLAGFGRITLNGIPNDPPERGGAGARAPGFVPSPEAVQEVKVFTAMYDAQDGHGGGLLINSVLRAGANSYHGSAYYIFQNTYLNSNDAERTWATRNGTYEPRPNDQWNQPGFVVDGPVRIPHLYDGRDKSFFMVAMERIQNILPQTNTESVPTSKMRNGDFSELLSPTGTCPSGTTYTCLYDPLTGASNGVRTRFANNDISARLNPVGKALLNSYPLPNVPGSGLAGLKDNYVSVETSSSDRYYSLAVRFDQEINGSNKLTAVFVHSPRHAIRNNSGFPGPGGPGFTHTLNNDGGSLDLVTVLSPTLVLDSRVGGIYHPFTIRPNGYNYDITKVGFPGSLAAQLPIETFPAISVSDGASALTTGQGQFSGTTQLEASALLSQAVSRHSFRYGVQYQLLRFNYNNPTSGLGTFSFNRRFTQSNGVGVVDGDVNAGYGFASLALGYPSGGTQATNSPSAFQQHYFALFFQDDWRITSKLTLNLGLRWDMDEPLTERHDEVNAGFCFTCVSPIQVVGLPTLTGGLMFADPRHRYPYNRDRDNFQPRIGLAWQLNPVQVLRIGFGSIYPQDFNQPGSTGYSATTGYAASSGIGTIPSTSLSNPYPGGLNAPTGRGAGLITALGQSITFLDRDARDPRVYQTSVNLQTQFPGRTIVEVGFFGTYVRNLSLSKNINVLPSKYFSLGADHLNAAVSNPLAGSIPNNVTLNAPTIQQHYLLEPYPQFAGINENGIPAGHSDYSALQIRVTRHVTNNLGLHFNFTWAKLMQNDYIDNTDDQPTRFQGAQPNLLLTATMLYLFPKFSSLKPVAREFLGGWEGNFVVRKHNGPLVANPAGVVPLRDPVLGSNQSYAHMFNNCYLTAAGKPVTPSTDPAGFCTVNNAAFQQIAAYTKNVIHPFMDHVRNMINPELDVSLFKIFKLQETKTFEIRGEFFNVLNSVNYAAPETTLTDPAFGSVSLTQVNDPRLGQLTVRFNF